MNTSLFWKHLTKWLPTARPGRDRYRQFSQNKKSSTTLISWTFWFCRLKSKKVDMNFSSEKRNTGEKIALNISKSDDKPKLTKSTCLAFYHLVGICHTMFYFWIMEANIFVVPIPKHGAVVNATFGKIRANLEVFVLLYKVFSNVKDQCVSAKEVISPSRREIWNKRPPPNINLKILRKKPCQLDRDLSAYWK